jgi:hypothetical protein
VIPGNVVLGGDVLTDEIRAAGLWGDGRPGPLSSIFKINRYSYSNTSVAPWAGANYKSGEAVSYFYDRLLPHASWGYPADEYLEKHTVHYLDQQPAGTGGDRAKVVWGQQDLDPEHKIMKGDLTVIRSSVFLPDYTLDATVPAGDIYIPAPATSWNFLTEIAAFGQQGQSPFQFRVDGANDCFQVKIHGGGLDDDTPVLGVNSGYITHPVTGEIMDGTSPYGLIWNRRIDYIIVALWSDDMDEGITDFFIDHDGDGFCEYAGRYQGANMFTNRLTNGNFLTRGLYRENFTETSTAYYGPISIGRSLNDQDYVDRPQPEEATVGFFDPFDNLAPNGRDFVDISSFTEGAGVDATVVASPVGGRFGPTAIRMETTSGMGTTWLDLVLTLEAEIHTVTFVLWADSDTNPGRVEVGQINFTGATGETFIEPPLYLNGIRKGTIQFTPVGDLTGTLRIRGSTTLGATAELYLLAIQVNDSLVAFPTTSGPLAEGGRLELAEDDLDSAQGCVVACFRPHYASSGIPGVPHVFHRVTPSGHYLAGKIDGGVVQMERSIGGAAVAADAAARSWQREQEITTVFAYDEDELKTAFRGEVVTVADPRSLPEEGMETNWIGAEIGSSVNRLNGALFWVAGLKEVPTDARLIELSRLFSDASAEDIPEAHFFYTGEGDGTHYVTDTEPPVVVTDPGQRHLPGSWTLVVDDKSGPGSRELPYQDVSVTRRENGAMTLQGRVDVESEASQLLLPGSSSIRGYREPRGGGDKVLRFRGKVAEPHSDDQNSVEFFAADPLWWASFRRIYGIVGGAVAYDQARVFTQIDAGAIAWALLNDQNLYRNTLRIKQGLIELSVKRDRTYDPGKNLLEALTELAEIDGGFFFHADPVEDEGVHAALVVRWPDSGGDLEGVRFEYGAGTLGNLEGFRREHRLPRNGITATGSGDGEGRLSARAEDLASIAAFDLIEDELSLQDVTSFSTLAAHAQEEIRGETQYVYSVTPLPTGAEDAEEPIGFALWDDFDVGDNVRLTIDHGRVRDFDVPVRVAEATVSISDVATEEQLSGLLLETIPASSPRTFDPTSVRPSESPATGTLIQGVKVGQTQTTSPRLSRTLQRYG